MSLFEDSAPAEEKRAPDLTWDAMVSACGYDETVTQTERGRINAALKELRTIYPRSTSYAIAIDIAARAEVYRRKFPGMEVTPQALVGNWSRLDPSSESAGGERATSAVDTPPPAHCETCHGLRMVVFNVRSDGSEEMAPCPACHANPMAAGFWRYDGTRANPPEPKAVRAAMIRLLEADHGDL